MSENDAVKKQVSVQNSIEPKTEALLYDNGADEALKFVAGRDVHIDEETNARIRRKIDLHLIPWMGSLFALQYLDKTTLSYAASMGIIQENQLSAWEYGWAGSMFYLGYLVFEYPHNRLMQIFPLGRYLAASVIVWGAILALTAVTHNAAGVFATRFFLGACEGAITAGFVLITSRFYRLEEQAMRTAIWYTLNAGGTIIGGLMAYGISRGFKAAQYPFPTWKAMFLVTGVATAVYGVFLYFFLPESPVAARWLSEEDKVLAVARIRGNQQGFGSKEFKWYQFREAFTDVRTYLIFVFMVTATVPSGGLTVFFTQLIAGYGFDTDTTFLVSIPMAVPQILSGLGIPYLAYRFRNRMAAACLAVLVGLFGISLMMGLSRSGPTDNRIGQLVGYYITLGNSATAIILVLSNISSNTAGFTKKTTVNAVSLIAYCVGFLVGPNVFGSAPYFTTGKWVTIGMYSVSFLCCLGLYVVNRADNRKKLADRAQLPPQQEGQEFADLTDKENPYFVYTL